MCMKKHLTLLLFSLLFLTVTAMTCEDAPEEMKEIPCNLKAVELYHWDNSGELPVEPVDHKVPKAAYLFEIRLMTEIAEDQIESYYDHNLTISVLSDGIKKIQIFTETPFNEAFPEGADVTSCFQNYPKTVVEYQETDFTVRGGTISVVDKTNRLLKALMTIPQPGEYRFRVVLTKESGETVEQISDPISLY